MRLHMPRPSVVAMSNDGILRIGAVAAVTGAVAQLVATVLEPDWGGDPGEAVRVVANSGFWIGDRLLDLVGLLLTVAALSVVARTFTEGAGRDWARLGQPFLVLLGALGSVAILAGATMKDVADTWAGAVPGAKQSYLAVFDTTTYATEAMFFGAFMALALYLATLALAILSSAVYAHWIGWGAVVSAALILVGNLGSIVTEPAWLAVLAGFALFLALLVALGVAMWRVAATPRGRRSASPAADSHIA